MNMHFTHNKSEKSPSEKKEIPPNFLQGHQIGFKPSALVIIHTVKSRAVDRSTIQFLTIFGVLLTETCY